MDGTAILARLRERLGDRLLATHEYRGDHTAVVAREGLVAALSLCRDDAALGFDMLVDVTAVDYLRFPGREDGPRFEVVYHLYSVGNNHRVRLKVPGAFHAVTLAAWPTRLRLSAGLSGLATCRSRRKFDPTGIWRC